VGGQGGFVAPDGNVVAMSGAWLSLEFAGKCYTRELNADMTMLLMNFAIFSFRT
jgi:hypothetical protein